MISMLADAIVPILAASFAGLVASVVSRRSAKKDKAEVKADLDKANLKLELKDLQIQLYQVEKDLDAWKEKYYGALQQLIEVKGELEETMIKLTSIQHEHLLPTAGLRDA